MVTDKMKNAMVQYADSMIALANVWNEKGYKNELYPFTEDFDTMLDRVVTWVADNTAQTLWEKFLFESGEEDSESPELLARFEAWAPYVVTREIDSDDFVWHTLYRDGKKHRTNEEIIFRAREIEDAREVLRTEMEANSHDE